MIVDGEAGLTILGRCGLPPVRLVVENTRSWEWISLPRREPRKPRDRLPPLKQMWPDRLQVRKCIFDLGKFWVLISSIIWLFSFER
jgi:hypothetical protein